VNTLRRIYYALTGRVCPWVAKDLEVEKKKLAQMNRLVTIVTVTLALMYGGYCAFDVLSRPLRCCDGPCWDGK
jgi:hypothetical protein